MRYRWKDDPWWNDSPGRPFRMAALGAAVGLPALLFAALVRNAVVHPATPVNPVDVVVKKMNGDPDRDVRLNAMHELWQDGHRDRVFSALFGGPPAVRSDAGDFVVEQGAEVVPDLLSQLFDPRQRGTGTAILVRIGPAALNRMIAELSQSSGEMTVLLIGVLGEFGPAVAGQTLPAFQQVLRAGDATARFAACEQLSRLGSAAHGAIPDLIAALNDADTGVRMHAMQTLGGFGTAAERAVPALAKSLRDPGVTNAVAAALGQIGGPAIEPLAAGLDDPSPEVRLASVHALGAIGPPAAKAVEKLSRLAKDDANFKLQRAAIVALGAIGPPVKNEKR